MKRILLNFLPIAIGIAISNKIKSTFAMSFSKRAIFLFLIFINFSLFTFHSFSQGVAINVLGNVPDPKAILDISSTTSPFQGMLIPRMTTAERDAITAPIPLSLFIFNTSTNCFESYVNGAWNIVSCPATCIPPAQPDAITGDATVCESQSEVYSILTVPLASSYSWSVPAGWSIFDGQGTISLTVTTGNSSQSGNVNVTANNSCGASVPLQTLHVTINHASVAGTASALPNQVCINSNTTLSLVGNTGSIQWQSSPDNVTYTNISGATTTPYTTVGGITSNTYYQAVVTGGVCSSENSNIILVNVDLVTTGGISASQTICSGVTPSLLTSTTAGTGSGAITYEWQTNATGSYVTIGLATSATYQPPALTATTSYQRRTVSTLSGNICYSAYTAPVTITVQSIPTEGGIGTDQTICYNAAPALLTSTTDGTGSGTITYEWQTNASGSYVTIGSATAATYQPPALTATTSYKRRTVSTLSGNICYSVYTSPVTITVNTSLTAGSIGTSQTICNGATPALLTSATAGTGPGAITYEWQTNATGSYVTIGSALAATYQPPALTATTSYQRRTVSISGGATCYSAYTTAVTITVQSAMTEGGIGTDQTICYNTTPALLTSTTAGTGSGTITYEWQTNATGSYVTIGSATASTYQPPALTSTTNYQRRTVSTLSGNICYSAYTAPVTITVNAAVTSGTIGTAQTICNGATPALLTSLTAGTGSGTITYEWQTNATGSYVTIPGETGDSYQPPALTATTNYQRRTVSVSGGTTCYSAYTTAVTITVQSIPTVGVIATNQTICYNTSPALLTSTTAGTGSGTITYEWQTNASGSYVTIPSATAATYQPPTLTATTSYQRRTVSTLSGNICYSAYTTAVTITVQSTPTEGVIGTDQTICYNTTPALLTSITAGTGSGTITYEWQTNASGSYVTIPSATAATYQPPALTATTSYQRRTVSTLSGNICYSVYTTSVTITVNVAVTAGTIGTAQTICNGSTPALLTSTSAGTGTGTITYEWQTNATGSYVTIPGETGDTYQPPALTVTTSYKRRTVSVSDATCYSAYTTAVTITVQSIPTEGGIGTDQTICYNTSPALLTSITAGTGSGTITYEWQTNASGSYVTIPSATAATYQPPALTATTSYQRRTVSTLSGNICYSDYTTPVTITVNAVVTAGTIGTAQTICNGSTPALLTSTSAGTGPGTITYQWQTNATGSYVTIPGETGDTYQPPALTATTSYQRRTVSVSGGITCYSAYTTAITITVQSIPTAGSIGTAQAICYNTTPALLTSITAGTGSGTITYEWQTNATGSYVTIPGEITSTYQPPALITTTSYQRRTVSTLSGNICYSAYTTAVTITVQSIPTEGGIGTDQTICYNTLPALLTSTLAGTGSGTITYEWQTNASGSYVTIGSATAATYQPPALTATTSYQRRTVSTLSGNICYSAYTAPVTITVNAAVTAGTIGTAQTICNGITPALLTSITAGTGPGTITYEWQTNATGSYVTIPGEILDTYQPPALTSTTSYQRRTVSVSGGISCYSAYITVTITVQSIPTAGTIGTAQTICYNTAPAMLTSTLAGTGSGTITYEWQTNASGSYVTIGLATSATYQPPALTATTSYQRRTVSTLSGNICYSVYTAPVTITVQSTPTAGGIGTAQTICYGTAPAMLTSTTDGTGDGTITYAWQTNASGSYVTIGSATAAAYQPPSLTSTTSYQRRTVSTLSGAICYSAYTTPVTITVNANLTAGISPSSTSICSNTAPGTFTATGGGGTGSYSYLWYKNGVTTGITSQTYVPGILTATSTFYCAITSGSCGTVNTPTTTITVYLYWNTAQSASNYARNNCTCQTGSTPTYTVAANLYSSCISQADANAQALSAATAANTQAWANANGSCSGALCGNTAQSVANYTRNNCTACQTGSTPTYTVAANTYYSSISVTAANTTAHDAAVAANTQAWANANGSCSGALCGNTVQSVANYTKNNCTCQTGSAPTYTVPANTYYSSTSVADANTTAYNAAVAANTQAWANANGSCSGALCGNTAQSVANYTRNNCTACQTGSTPTYTVAANTYYSGISVAAANTTAHDAAVAANTQAWANANGTCSGIPYTIGQSYKGGKIAYIDGTGCHGFIAATSDNSTGIRWGCCNVEGTDWAGGNGLQNTLDILAKDANAGAAKLCNDYSIVDGGVTYSDWYLPSISEFQTMYANYAAIGGFQPPYTNGVCYWSSTRGGMTDTYNNYCDWGAEGCGYTQSCGAAYVLPCINPSDNLTRLRDNLWRVRCIMNF